MTAIAPVPTSARPVGAKSPARPAATPSPEEQRIAAEIRAVDIRADIDKLAELPRVAASPRYLEMAGHVANAANAAGWSAAVVPMENKSWFGTQTSNNVVAERKGTAPDGERGLVILGAHLDSVSRAPGGNDNASGSAALLDVVRALGSLPPSRNDVRVVWFDREEQGLFGSAAYVRQLPKEDVARTLGMLNADMIGSPHGDIGFSLGARTSDGIGTVVKEVAQRNGIAAVMHPERHSRSDHHSFDRAGIQSVDFGVSVRTIGKDDPNYHSPKDTKDNINSTVLEGFADLIGLSAWELANRSEIPKGVAPPSDVKIITGPPK